MAENSLIHRSEHRVVLKLIIASKDGQAINNLISIEKTPLN